MLNKFYQRRSIIVALFIAVGSLLWVLSGLGKDSRDPQNAERQGSASEQQAEQALPRVTIQTRTAVNTWQQFDGAGAIEANRAVDIRSGLEARVVAVNVEEGDEVAKGDALVQLSPKHIPQQLRLAEARLAQAKLQYQSAKKLAAQGLQNQLKVAEAKSGLESAKADVDGAKVAVRELTFSAPFAATVQTVDVELGALIRPGERGVRLVQMDELLAVVAVTAEVATQLTKGQIATVTDRKGQVYDATVKYVSPEPSAQSRLYRVEASLRPMPHVKAKLAIGQPVEVVLPLREVLAHKIAASLLWLDADGNMGVRAVDDNNVVTFYEADFLRSEGGELWLTGLPTEFDLITNGQGLVRTGAKVQVQTPTQTDSAQL